MPRCLAFDGKAGSFSNALPIRTSIVIARSAAPDLRIARETKEQADAAQLDDRRLKGLAATPWAW
jgi:purine-nucleoside phosphorylase